jgi:hypothetical protein
MRTSPHDLVQCSQHRGSALQECRILAPQQASSQPPREAIAARAGTRAWCLRPLVAADLTATSQARLAARCPGGRAACTAHALRARPAAVPAAPPQSRAETASCRVHRMTRRPAPGRTAVHVRSKAAPGRTSSSMTGSQGHILRITCVLRWQRARAVASGQAAHDLARLGMAAEVKKRCSAWRRRATARHAFW